MSVFLLQLKEHKGVFYHDSASGICHSDEMLLNLNMIDRIFFDDKTDSAPDKGHKIKHSITFYYPPHFEQLPVSLLFTEEGMGEFNRLKRTIEKGLV